MAIAKSFHDLTVWKIGRDLEKLYGIAKTLSMTMQSSCSD